MEFESIWILWLLAFVGIEGAAVLNKKRGDTLTAHVIRWFNATRAEGWNKKRLTLLASMVGLTAHFVWGWLA